MGGSCQSPVISCLTCDRGANSSALFCTLYRAFRVFCIHLIKCTSYRGRQNESAGWYLHCGQSEQICHAAVSKLGSADHCTDLGVGEVPLEGGIADEYCFISNCASFIDFFEADAAASWG